VIALTYQNPQLEKMVTEYDGFVAPGDDIEKIVTTISQVYDKWKDASLIGANRPGISVRQSVGAILENIERTDY
jgi:hypothetical protein